MNQTRRRKAVRLNSGVRPMRKFTRYFVIAAAVTALSIPAAWFGVQRTDAYAAASSYARTSADVRSHVGEVQKIDLAFFGYRIQVAGSDGNANFNLKLDGSIAKGILHVDLVRHGTWQVKGSRLVLTDGQEIAIPR